MLAYECGDIRDGETNRARQASKDRQSHPGTGDSGVPGDHPLSAPGSRHVALIDLMPPQRRSTNTAGVLAVKRAFVTPKGGWVLRRPVLRTSQPGRACLP